ncbi:BON domain-containing protein [Herbaspirillum lusitanum]|jgi:osmotically-inducible protein OsmY|uniref:BON domain-containing protein n=1 Tax=Herbaspirillum lusitanum TaxID=213312 RepID=A0ABW9ABS3_9BURK
MINTSMISITRRFAIVFMSVLMLALAGCASNSKQSSTGEMLDDTVITTRVKAAIFNEPDLKTTEIKVKTFKGDVQLSGFVSSQAAVNKAVAVARKVPGVSSVTNSMIVK